MAFDGQLEPIRTRAAYRRSIMLVFCAMILLPVIYIGIIVLTAYGVIAYAKAAGVLLRFLGHGGITGMACVVALYVAPIFAGAMLVLFMILPLFWRSQKEERPYWVDRREQPLLYAYIEKLCDAIGAPRPTRIDVLAGANASAGLDNGVFGLLNRKMVLTIGLPLARSTDLKQFTAVVAHELGHFSQGGFIRLSYVIRAINKRFLYLAYAPSGVEEFIKELADADSHLSVHFVVFVSRSAIGLTRLVLKGLGLLSHILSMSLARQAEFDADLQAARIVGSETAAEMMQLIPAIDIASDLSVHIAREAWFRKTLPDDIVELTHFLQENLPQKKRDELEALILSQEQSWFDTHPPLYVRIGALKKANLKGVLKLNGPASLLFRDFDDLCKMTTVAFYSRVLGEHLQPEHLISTAEFRPRAMAFAKQR